ncbi:hypothetical protein [Gordonia jinghuaiqii]|uniref:hypothetical protein n=1 Tax=Gordonia jinghuaiqii TaxID=2758710 RepID=UPI001CB79490|nr:hypothetical protein [Gordonia jinghuaiqii]
MTIELDAPAARNSATDTSTGTAATNTVSIGRPQFQIAVAGDPLARTFPLVVRRETLRDAQRARSLLRAGSHDPAKFVVALEVEVAIAPQAASARAAAEHAGRFAAIDSETVRYVGTVSGLTTLLRDIYAAEVADAVILTPIDGAATEQRIREEVLPVFENARYRVA